MKQRLLVEWTKITFWASLYVRGRNDFYDIGIDARCRAVTLIELVVDMSLLTCHL